MRERMTGRGLDVILQADAIRPPLTGIGRYATELARGLSSHSAVARLRYFGLASWLKDPLSAFDNQRDSRGGSVNEQTQHTWQSWLRTRLATNSLAVKAYRTVGPPLAGWRLRNEAESLYHSPNYFLPRVEGPAIATIHDLSHEIYPSFHPGARVEFMLRALPESLRHATYLITDAESVRQEVIDCYQWPEDRISAVPLGVDPSFHPRENQILLPWLGSQGLRPDGYCLYVGTIEPRKNVDGLLAAYAMLPLALRRSFPLVLAGGTGWQSQKTHERISQAVAQGWAHYLSFVPQAQLPLLYAGARAFAFPSHYEGFGLPVLEAMASGVSVVTSDNSSLPEVIGSAGLTVSPQDIDGLSQALSHLLQDDGARAHFRALALARASTFTWQRCVDATVSVYERIYTGDES